jgi:hypothetical protein
VLETRFACFFRDFLVQQSQIGDVSVVDITEIQVHGVDAAPWKSRVGHLGGEQAALNVLNYVVAHSPDRVTRRFPPR